MKYNAPTLRQLGEDRWQARFRFKEGGEWHEISRNISARGMRAARKAASELHEELEAEAARQALGPTLVLDDDDSKLGAFLERYIESLCAHKNICRRIAYLNDIGS